MSHQLGLFACSVVARKTLKNIAGESAKWALLIPRSAKPELQK
jgi:hypothetical protein